MTDPRPPLLLTRPAAQAERFAAQVTKRFGPVRIVQSPILKIVPRQVDLTDLNVTAVILTSENGVRALVGHPGLTAYCVGDRTAQAAKEIGLNARSADGAAQDLVALVKAEAPSGPLLFARGTETRGAVAEQVRNAGFEVVDRVVYEQVPQGLSTSAKTLLQGKDPVVAPVFSPRSAALLSAAWQGATAPLCLISLSQTVDAAWSGPLPAQRHIAAAPTAASILNELITHYP